MLERMTLREEQQEALDTMLSTDSGGILLGAEMGTGKTVLGVEYVLQTNAQTVLLIAPLQTRGETLEEEDIFAEGWWGTFDLQGSTLPFRHIENSDSGKKALADYSWGVPGIYFVGQEYFVRLGWTKVPLFNKDKTPRLNPKTKKQLTKNVKTDAWDFEPDVVIFDEVHRAQSHESWTHKTLMNVNAGMKIGSSGTPTGNSFDGAYAICKWLWPHLAEKNIYDWRDKWAEVIYDHFAVRNQRTVGEKVPGAYFNQLPCYIRLEADFNIEVIKKKFYVNLTSEQRRVYNELEDRMVAWIKDNPLTVEFPMTKRMRMRQSTLGMPSITYIENDEGDLDVEVGFDLDCESSKIDEILIPKVLDGFFEGENALIYTDSQIFADVLVHRLNQRYGEGSTRKWSGKVSKKQRKLNKQAFLRGEFHYMVCVIQAMGTGTDLLQKVCRNMVYVSIDDSRIDNDQSFSRLVRGGSFSEFVRAAWIIARDTIDTGQYSKQLQDAIKMNASLKKKARK